MRKGFTICTVLGFLIVLSACATAFAGTIAGHLLTVGPGTYFTDFQGNTYSLEGSVSLGDAGGLPEYMFFGVNGVDLSNQGNGVTIISNDENWGNNGWPGVTLDKYFFNKEHIWDTSTGGMFTADVAVSLPGLPTFPAVINPDMPFEGGVINENGSLFGSAYNPMAISVINLKVYAIVPKGDTIFINFNPTMTPWNYNDSLFKGQIADASYENLNFSLAEIGTLSIVVPQPLGMFSNPNASVTQSRVQYDRINRMFFVLLTVINNGSEPIVGPAHLLIKNSSLPLLNADGSNNDGTPYITFLTEGETLAPGASIGAIRANFPLKRVRLTFQTGVESMLPVQPQLCDVSGTVTLNGAPATDYRIRIYNDQFGGVDRIFNVDSSGTYTALGVPCGASTLYVYDSFDNYIGSINRELPTNANIDLYQWHISVEEPGCRIPAIVNFFSNVRGTSIYLDENGEGSITTVGEETFYISLQDDFGLEMATFSGVTLGNIDNSYPADSQCGQLDVYADSLSLEFYDLDCVCQGQGEEIWVCVDLFWGCELGVENEFDFWNDYGNNFLNVSSTVQCIQIPEGEYMLDIYGDSNIWATLYDQINITLTNEVQEPNCTPGSVKTGTWCDYDSFLLYACNGECCVAPYYDETIQDNYMGVRLLKWIAMYDANGDGEEEPVQFISLSDCSELFDQCGYPDNHMGEVLD